MTCITKGCARARREPVNGIRFAHCDACLERLLREAFGPVAWTERALTNTLPPMVVGGVPIDPPAQPRSAPPRLDQGADLSDWAPGELVEVFGR
jgi:hypothetical protein